MKPHRRACDTTSSFANADATANHIGKLYFELYLKKKRVGFFLIWSLLDQPFWWCVLHTTNYAFFDHLLSPFYHKTGTMGRISSTSYVLPIRLSYRMLNRVIRVHRLNFKCDFIKQFTSLCYPGHNNLDDLWLAQANDLSRINTHGLQHKENCIQRNVLLDAIFTKSTTYNFCSFS